MVFFSSSLNDFLTVGRRILMSIFIPTTFVSKVGTEAFWLSTGSCYLGHVQYTNSEAFDKISCGCYGWLLAVQLCIRTSSNGSPAPQKCII